jgi:hypothetical protein
MATTVAIRPGRGRCAVAAAAIPAGTVLPAFSGIPYAACLLVSQWPLRCAACFKQRADTAAVDAAPASLLRCSRCRCARYCNAECQRADWPQHKRECPVTQQLQAQCEDVVACAEVLTAGRCLWRRRGEPVGGSSSAAAEEFDALAPGFGVDEGDEGLTQLALSLAGLVPPGTRARDLATLFAKFRCNNFGVQDTLKMDLVGAACHPRAAILNHSCAPNCALLYRGKAVEVRTLRDVARGEELCHSYTNLCRTTSERQQVLRDVYGFHCDCRRCVDDVVLTDGGRRVDDVMRGMWDNHDASGRKAVGRVRELAAEAAEIDDSDDSDHAEALERRRRKRALIFEALELVRGVCLPGSMMRYPLESAALDDLLALTQQQLGNVVVGGGENDKAARECCANVVKFQEMVFSHVPFHPLLSLQRATLADLHESCGDRRAAVATLRLCLHALRVTHGPGVDLYDQTTARLAELTQGLAVMGEEEAEVVVVEQAEAVVVVEKHD